MKTVLDDELSVEGQSKEKSKLINWTSIIILWGGLSYCFVDGSITETKVIIGVLLLLVSTATTFFKYEVGTKITLGAIVIGVFSLAKYFPISYSIGFGVGGFSLTFEVLILLIGIVHYLTNKEILSKFVSGLMNRKVSKEELQAKERRRINGYKNQFSKKNMEELEAIANNERLLPEAIEAAKELIEKIKIGENKA